MKLTLTVKTLKGGKFDIEVDGHQTVAQVKDAIAAAKSDLPAETQKLIHSGKVLKDDSTVEACGIKSKDFLVVMLSKPKAAASKPVASSPATDTPAPALPVAEDTPLLPPTAPAQNNDIPQDAVDNLTAMGFPEAEVRHCLRAAQGNPDVAVEFLTNGIPDGLSQPLNASADSLTPAASRSRQPLQGLRDHPQFNDLRRLVQSNPQMLQQVLAQIGQQQPELLAEINSNQGRFLEMMNEPIDNEESDVARGAPNQALMDGLQHPAQMAEMIQNLSPEELEQMARMMGLSSEQLRVTARMLGQMPPEQLQQFMMQAIGGANGPGVGGVETGGQQVLRLTEEEMAAVNRLADLGFERSEAAQAYLACDKNEALAANLLMDSMGEASGGFGGGGSNPGQDGSGSDEDMYD